MDKKDWSWMQQHMPGVVALIRSKRQELGAAFVNTCWRRGVLRCEPGWFYAREGAVAVGVPFVGSEIDTVIRELGAWDDLRDSPLLMLKSLDAVGENDGAN